jgi:uncharacterized coiled-coil protein SlyX
MNGRPEDLEKRLATAEAMLRSLQETLARTQQLIDQARQMLTDPDGPGEPPADAPTTQ